MHNDLKKLSEKIQKQIKKIQNEEETKHAFILPFLNLLGYDVFDPDEVKPEYTADIGNKAGEKVDYAILKNEKLCFFIECKACTVHLDKTHCNQLKRYFNSIPEVPFGILTNGFIYRFYADFRHKNIMDEEPFLEINLLNLHNYDLVEKLAHFTKDKFDIQTNRAAACCWKYEEKMKKVLEEERGQVSEELFRFFLKKANLGDLSADFNLTVPLRNQIEQQLKQQIQQFLGIEKNSIPCVKTHNIGPAPIWYYFDNSINSNIFNGKKLCQARIFEQNFGKKSWASLTGDIFSEIFKRLDTVQQHTCVDQFKFIYLKSEAGKLRNSVHIGEGQYVLDTNTSVLGKYQQISKVLAFLKERMHLNFIQEISFELLDE